MFASIPYSVGGNSATGDLKGSFGVPEGYKLIAVKGYLTGSPSVVPVRLSLSGTTNQATVVLRNLSGTASSASMGIDAVAVRTSAF